MKEALNIFRYKQILHEIENIVLELKCGANMIYLTPFGFDPSHVISGIAENGIKDDDRIVLVIPEENENDERFIRGKQEVENIINSISEAKVEPLKVNHKKFQEAVLIISNFISEQNEKFYLNASQAAREILIATLIASLFQRNKFEDITIFSDVDRSSIDADLPYLREMSENEKHMVAKIEDGITVSQLADKLDVDDSTASRKTQNLENKNIIETEKIGRSKKLRLTFTGKIYKTIEKT